VWACEKFHPYIYGVEFNLLTDHKPLEFIYGKRSKPCACVETWVLRLQTYTYRVVHLPGKDNIVVSLSRLLPTEEVEQSKESKAAEVYVRFVAVNATPNAVTMKEIERASGDDEELTLVRNCVEANRFDDCEQNIYAAISGELCVIGKLLLRGTRIVIPKVIRPRIVEANRFDDCAQKIYAAISGELCVIGKFLLRGTRIMVPKVLRPRILALANEGHFGIVDTKRVLRTKVWWPGIDREAERLC